jgi:signal peptidase I
MNEEFDFNEKKGAVAREAFDWVESALTAICCVILVFTFMGRLVGVEGESMLPTLEDQDRLVAAHIMYKPKNGDIVVVTKPNSKNEPLIKRVIAVGGQSLDIDFAQNAVYVDGERVEEPYIYEPMDPGENLGEPVHVDIPEGYVYIMGDNRNYSWDSRVEEVGLVDERHILGKILYRVMPYDRIGVPQ